MSEAYMADACWATIASVMATNLTATPFALLPRPPRIVGVACDGCGRVCGTTIGVCPFAADVWNESVPAALCSDCEYQRLMDI